MNKLILAVVWTLASCVAMAESESASSAVAKKLPPKHPMPNELELTDEQVQEMRAIRDAGGTRADINAVLTPEQKDKAVKIRKQRHGNPANRMDRMQQHLGLTDEQVSEIGEIKERGGSRQEVREGIRGVLTPDQQAEFDAMQNKRKAKNAQTE
tara:strand:+ start:43767 stop:44228 length:462 start_codon:yes stop_codon:yes gene_type:complete